MTNGSDRGINVVLRAFLSPGDGMLVARPEFAMFGITAGLLNARVIGVPYEAGFRYPYDAFLRAISPDVKLIVAINPNNPTGTPIAPELPRTSDPQLSRNPRARERSVLRIHRFTAMVDLVRSCPNVIILPPFSKAFAMAGLRLGYLILPGLIREFHKIRGPFNVNSLALQAAAAQDRSPGGLPRSRH